MIMSLVLFENEFLHIVSISFTALILNELIMVALEITTWHVYMIISEIVTLFLYVISMAFLPEYFGMLPYCSFSPSKRPSHELVLPFRSDIRRHRRLCVESRCYCCHICIASLDYQAHSQAHLSGCVN